MKPNFALSLSFDGIGLLHRRFPGWTQVDEVALDTPDLTAALAAMRTKAAALDPSGLRTKLVIPNDQIKYLTIPSNGIAPGDEEAAVRAALEGATPYAVDDLAYDWSLMQDTISIAAVARETLDEAENFAADHDFAPVSHVAIPDADTYRGEPCFGETAHARSILGPGEAVQRDDAPIRVIGVSRPVPMGDSTPVAAQDDEDIAPPVPADEAPAPEPQNADGETSSPDAQETPEPASPEAGTPPATETDEDRDQDSPETEQEPEAEPARAFSSIRASRDAAAPPRPDSPAPELTAPSRLKGLIASKKPAGKAKKKKTALTPGVADSAPEPAPTLPSPGADMTPDPAQFAQAAASLRPDPATRLDADLAAASESESADPPPPAENKVAFFSGRRPRNPGSTEKRGAKATRKPDASAKARFEDEKQRMTVFGARDAPVGGKPRFLGLILTAVLLLFLVGVAAWASIFLDDGLARFFGGPEETRVTDVPAMEEDAGSDTALVARTDTPVDPPEPAGEEVAALEPPQQTESPAELDEEPAVQAPEGEVVAAALDPQEPLTPSAALARYAATGIWQMAPDAPEPPRPSGDAQRMFQVSLDPEITLEDIRPLPGTNATWRDARPETPGVPFPPGVTFDFDERGLVRATPEGAMTPLGIRVRAAPLPVTPPEAFRQRIPAAQPAPDSQEPEPVTEAEPEEPLPQAEQTAAGIVVNPDSPLVEFRPRLRPAGLAPEAEATTGATEAEPDVDASEAAAPPETAEAETDETALPEPVDPALAEVRPRPRPAGIAPEEDRAEDEEAAADLDAGAVDEAVALANETEDPAEERDETLFENPTPQAVSASLTPNQRPSNFAAIVERSRDNAAAEPVAAAQVLAPTIPSTASVAREATQGNVLNLRRVNLIGVYGSPTSRRALVRLANGRYKKVKVGDRLDGGRVAAIGDSELRYVKGGQNVTLKMPRG